MSKFKDALLEKDFLILTHRGFSGGNILENSRESALAARFSGADIVEVDIEKSSDGVYYLFHSDNEWRLLRHDKSLGQMTSSQIDQSQVYNSIGAKSGQYLEKLVDFLEWLPDDILVNIDRSWDFWGDGEFINILRNSGKLDQIILKSGYIPTALENLNKASLPVEFFLVTKTASEVEKLKDYENINLLGVEILANGESDEAYLTNWIKTLKAQGLLILVNAIDLGEGDDLFLGLDDTRAILSPDGYKSVFDELLTYQPDIIQTDWPNFLAQYRKAL